MEKPENQKRPLQTSIPFSGVRKIIAERLTKSHLSALHVTLVREMDATALKRLREKLLLEVKETRISYTDILLKATTEAIKEYPIVNSRLEGNEIRVLDQVNIGVAVALESGLIVPVVHNLERKSMIQASNELATLVSRANRGTLSLSEVTGGTFTLTNLGMFGVDAFTPIINPPETAVLGVGRIVEKPAVVEDRIEPRLMMTLSLTFDHRILDGATAALFLGRIVQILEKPEETDLFKA